MNGCILVTGASGFVGHALCIYLESKGENVCQVVRTLEKVVLNIPVQVVEDINPTTNWQDALAGIDVVVHLAARAHIMDDTVADPLTEFRKVNTAGTIHLARQAAACGVKRFVYVSTIKVNGEGSGVVPFLETDAPNCLDAYGISKWEAEQALTEMSEKMDMEVVIIRPPLVYGPGVRANFLRLMKWVDKGVPLPLAGIKNQRSLISLPNLVDILWKCICVPDAGGEVFLVSDGVDISISDLIRRIAGFMERPARLFTVPEIMLRGGGKILGKSAEIDRLCGTLRVDIRKARELLHWKPPVSLDQGLRQTVEWYLQHRK